MRIRFVIITLLVAATTADAAGPSRPVAAAVDTTTKTARGERLQRFLVRTADDLGYDAGVVKAEAEAVETELERVLPLEAPERKDFYRDMSERYRRYAEDLATAREDVSGLPGGKEGVQTRTSRILKKLRAATEKLSARLRTTEESADKEAARIATVIERRILLTDILRDLQERLERLEAKRHETERPDEEKDRRRLRREIEVRQNDLLALPPADEDLLRHYRLAGERLREEIDWLEVKAEDYETLADAAEALAAAADGERSVYRRIAGYYERQAGRMQRKAEGIERKANEVAPAGTLRGLDRSREAVEAFSSLRDRYLEQEKRYRQRAADYATEEGLAGT